MAAAVELSPTAVLSAEHRVIERVLDVLELLAREARADGRIADADALEVFEVLRTFADACHHGKEEAILFPALEAAMPGFGPAVVMRHEHEEGREFLRRAILASERADAASFARHADAYVDHLRRHIQKEDGCLWPMADRLLDDAAKRRVLDAFRRAEDDVVGPGVHAEMLDVVAGLCARRGLPPPSAPSCGTRSCGCKH